jgi:hypothetical protein
MGTSRIEQSIEDIFTFIEGCKSQPFARDKVIVPKEELYDLLDELRLRAPDEIKRYKKVLANREAIMADAEEKAANIIEERLCSRHLSRPTKSLPRRQRRPERF